MAVVTFPFHVKSKGRYYAPSEKITVENAEEAVNQGATIVEVLPEDKKEPKKPKQEKPKAKGGRPRKNP